MAGEPDDAAAAARPGSDRVFLAVALLLSLGLALVVAWFDYLPTNDGPQHIFAAYLQAHLDEAGKGWHRYLDHGPLVTGSGFVTLLGLLDRVLPWRPAFRIAIAALALLWAWSVVALAASLGPRRRWLGLVGFATALQWQFYMGLYSCYLATALGFLVLALAFHFGFARLRILLLLAALFALETTAHVVPAALTGLALVLYAVLSSAGPARMRVLLRTGLACAPAAGISLLAMLVSSDIDQFNHYSTSPPIGQRLALLGRAFVSGPAWRAWPVTMLAVAAAGIGIARWRRARADARELALLLAGLVLLLLAFATPLHIVGWEFFSVRFTPDAVVFLALLAPIELLPRRPWAWAAPAVLAAFAAAAIAWSFAHHQYLYRQHADFLAGLDAPLHRQGPRLPIFLEPPTGDAPYDWDRTVPFVTTNLHVGPLFSLVQGGVPAYLFAGGGAIHALTWRPPPDGVPMPPRPARGYEWGLWEPAARASPVLRERALAHMLGFAPRYEDVILWGTPADHAALRARGFVPDFARGGLMIARFAGCPTRLRLLPPPEGLPPTLVLSGWWPDSRPTFSTTLAPRPSNEGVELPLAGNPCGAIWVRVLFDVNHDGQMSPGDRICQGADGNAVLRLQVARDTDVVTCAAGESLP
jgi:hypothetical protein